MCFGLLYADNLVLCDELEEDWKAIVGWFVKVFIKVERNESQWR